MTSATKRMTRKQAVYAALKDARKGTITIDGTTHETPNGWIPGHILSSVGGVEGLRRLRELRAEGYSISMRRMKGVAEREYRLNRVKPLL